MHVIDCRTKDCWRGVSVGRAQTHYHGVGVRVTSGRCRRLPLASQQLLQPAVQPGRNLEVVGLGLARTKQHGGRGGL
eukprot:239752-Chlamydomonas_euryale.AAC.13